MLFRLSLTLALLLTSLFATQSEARFPRGTNVGSTFTFNNSKIQTNPNAIGAGAYPFLNVLKQSAPWSLANGANAPVTPDMLDVDGNLITNAGNASGGISTLAFVPTQDQKTGPYIYKWDGDGSVTSGNSFGASLAYTISSATQVGTVVTVNLSSAPSAMVAGQPISIGNFTFNWSGFNNTWRVQDVNVSCSNCFRIDTGVAYTGAATSSSPAATFTTTTTVANVVGNLNGSGRYAFQPSNTVGFNVQQFSLFTRIFSVQSSVNYPHNIRVVHLSDEAALDAGGIFTSKFKTALSKFGVARFLNWQYGQKQNVSNVTTWLTRRSPTYVQYTDYDLRPNLYAGSTTGLSGRTYTALAPAVNSATGAAWSGLTDKSTIHLLFAHGTWTTYPAVFTNGNPDIAISGHTYVNGDQVAFFTFAGPIPSNITANQYYFVCSASAGVSIRISTNVGCTGIVTPNASGSGPDSSAALFVDIGGTGAKKLLPVFVNPFINNQWPESGNYKSLATLVYDAALDAYIMYGGNTDFGSQGIINGAPYEVMLELCRQVGAHPWFVTPVLAADPVTDFMPSLMQMVKASGLMPQGMIPRYEPPNELWNIAFPQTAYATAKASAYGWAFGFDDWYGKALSTLGQAGAQIYGIGNLGTTYQMMGGVKSGNFVTGDTASAFPRFAANSYTGTTPQSPLTGSWGTITFTAVPPAINGTTGGSTTYVSHLTNAQYYLSNVVALGTGTQTSTTLATAWDGTQFTATFAAGAMTVASIDGGSALAVGKTISCPGVPSGVTITGGSAPNWTISNSSFSIAYSQGCTAGMDTTAPTKFTDSAVDTVVNATITGSNFVVNSITSGNTIGTFLQVYGGTIAYGSGVIINGGSYPNYTLNASPGNQTASFSIGSSLSLTGMGKTYGVWATWVKNNFGILRMAGYEGGYSNDYGGSAAINLVTYASKQTPSLQGYTTANFDNYRGIGSTSYPVGFTGEFPSVFNMTGGPVIGDAWSVLDDIYQNPAPPQWNAINSYPFLLKRDLDPASNDNSPMWLVQAA